MPLSRMVRGALVAAVAMSPAPFSQTFVDRLVSDDLRVVSYNVLWDTIFPNEDAIQAAKFERVVLALEPDVLALQEIGFSVPVSNVINLMNDIAPIPGGWHGHKAGDCVTLSRWPLTMKATETIPEGDKDQAMALVDLPDASYPFDLYVMNNHYKCCGGFDDRRQDQSDSIIAWMRDARQPGGFITLPVGTPMMVVGDLNIVGGPQPLQTLVDGNVIDESSYGADSPPDWDGTDSFDERPLHNVVGPADWTWSSPGPFPPGRLDFVIVTESVLASVHSFALNTTTMTSQALAAAGLQSNDVTVDSQGVDFDHLPLVVDYRVALDPWSDLGGPLAGTAGVPELSGECPLAAGTPVSLALVGARPLAATTLVVGLSTLGVPFKGGTLVPALDLLVSGLTTDAAGALEILSTWPVGVPSGTDFAFQHWIVDPTGPQGLAASNGVGATVP